MNTFTRILIFAFALAGASSSCLANGGWINVRDFGAVGDGVARDTGAIAKAIAACSKADGGTVFIPAGRYLTAPIRIESNLTLHVGSGAELLLDAELKGAPATNRVSALVYAFEKENIVIEGAGTLRGASQGGKLFHVIGCENVQVRGVRFKSEHPEGNGIAIDSSRNIRISDCSFDVSGDAVSLGSGRDPDRRGAAQPTELVIVTNCVVYQGSGALVISGESLGGVRNVTASNIICHRTDFGIRIHAAGTRGGVIENLRFDNWVIEDATSAAIQISGEGIDLPANASQEGKAFIRDVAISKVTISNAGKAISVSGGKELPIERLRFSDVTATGRSGFHCNVATDIEINDVRIDAKFGPQFLITDSEEVLLNNVGSRDTSSEPVISAHGVRSLWLTNSRVMKGQRTFLQVLGYQSEGIVLSGNEISQARELVMVGPDVPEGKVTVK